MIKIEEEYIQQKVSIKKKKEKEKESKKRITRRHINTKIRTKNMKINNCDI